MTLRADPDPERAKRGGNKLPVRATRARRRNWAPWLKRSIRWGGIGAVVLALGGTGYAATRPGVLAGFAAAAGRGALAATGALGLKVDQILVEGRNRVPARDAKGAVVQDEAGEFAHLPIVVGDDAPAHAEALLFLLATEPDLQKRVTAAVRVGGRRWNLKLDNGIDVRLPEEDAASAWSRLATLERDNKLLSRDVVAIDLRLPDRLIVRVGADTAPTPVPQDRATRRPATR